MAASISQVVITRCESRPTSGTIASSSGAYTLWALGRVAWLVALVSVLL